MSGRARRLSEKYTQRIDPRIKEIRESRRHLSQREKRKLEKISQTNWAAAQDVVATDVPLDARWQLLQKHGNFSLAYSTMIQPRLLHFGDRDGYVAHRKRWGFTFALGDPVTSAQRRPELLKRFIDQHRRPAFCQVSYQTAKCLSELGYRVNEIGVDTSLHFDEYSLAGKEKEWLRYAGNWCKRRGYEVHEWNFDQVDPAQVEAVSEAWRKTRTVKRKEVRFINRPIQLVDEIDVRKFFLIGPAGNVQAYVFLDPLYLDAAITGYVTVIKRRHPDAPQYAEHAIMRHVIEVLKAEGVGQLKLGLSPMAWIEDDEFQPSWIVQKAFRTCFGSKMINRRFYNLVGHADYKRRFRGREEHLYYAAPKHWSGSRLMALLGLCGIA